MGKCAGQEPGYVMLGGVMRTVLKSIHLARIELATFSV